MNSISKQDPSGRDASRHSGRRGKGGATGQRGKSGSPGPSAAGGGLPPRPSADHRAYQPRGAAETLLYSHDREILLVGPAGTGKTRAALEKIFLCMCRHPGIRVLLVRKTRQSLTQSAMITWETKVVPAGHSMLRGPSRAYRTAYAMKNGSHLVLGSMDNPDRIMSTEFDLVLACEATELELDDWEKLLTRLRNGVLPFQQAVAECNPSFPSHWLNQRADAGLMTRLISRHQDNPLLFEAHTGQWTAAGNHYLATLNRLTGVRREQLLHGIWTQAEGLVYPALPGAVRPFCPPMPPAGRAVMGLDWGWTDPLAAVVGVLNMENNLQIVDEIYAEKLPLESLINRLNALREKWRIESIFADPARPELIHALQRADFSCHPPPMRGIETGISLVESRLLAGLLTVDPACVHLLREAVEYRYVPRTGGNPGPRSFAGRDHAMDALRYLVCGLDTGPDVPEMGGPPPAESRPASRPPGRPQFTFEQVWGP